MKKFALVVLFTLFSLTNHDADAKRFGGGRSIGKHHESPPTTPKQATPHNGETSPHSTAHETTSGATSNVSPSKASFESPAPQSSGASTAASTQSKTNNWLGPLAGLAAGAGLAAILLNNPLSSIGVVLLLGLLLFMCWKMLYRPREPGYATGGREPTLKELTAQENTGGPREPTLSALASQSVKPIKEVHPQQAQQPAGGLNVDAFLHHAKVNFVRLQFANDAKNVKEIQQFTTPEMYGEILSEIKSRGDVEQRTEVVKLDAQLLAISTDKNHHNASVRFSGMLREQTGSAAEPFNEVWHLQKPVDGTSGWLIAGIQQVQ